MSFGLHDASNSEGIAMTLYAILLICAYGFMYFLMGANK